MALTTDARGAATGGLRPETVRRAFYLWGEINREYQRCRDPQTRGLLKARRDGIVSLVRRNAEQEREYPD